MNPNDHGYYHQDQPYRDAEQPKARQMTLAERLVAAERRIAELEELLTKTISDMESHHIRLNRVETETGLL